MCVVRVVVWCLCVVDQRKIGVCVADGKMRGCVCVCLLTGMPVTRWMRVCVCLCG